MNHRPRVYLIGAGPGDPDLLTVKALRLIQSADTVIYDRLISKEILDLIPVGVCKIFVGKATGHHSLDQSEINQLLVQVSRKNRVVVRLKGGDPYIFGRGAEEALVLKQHNIDFEVVPGITAAQACSAYSGIPLTHRGIARSVQYMTGHWQAGEDTDLSASALSDPQQTLVVYMGLANLDLVVEKALSAGRSPDTPAAIIEKGTTPQHRHLISSLKNITKTVRDQQVTPPALVIIGDVVEMATELAWFKPLAEEIDDVDYVYGNG